MDKIWKTLTLEVKFGINPMGALSKRPKPLAPFLPEKSNARGAAYQCKVGVD
jgi:hypothetical protein